MVMGDEPASSRCTRHGVRLLKAACAACRCDELYVRGSFREDGMSPEDELLAVMIRSACHRLYLVSSHPCMVTIPPETPDWVVDDQRRDLLDVRKVGPFPVPFVDPAIAERPVLRRYSQRFR